MKTAPDMKPPVTAADCSEEWIAVRREIIAREGRAVRGELMRCAIEVKSLIENTWHPLMLPNGAITFGSVQDRDRVLARLVGLTGKAAP